MGLGDRTDFCRDRGAATKMRDVDAANNFNIPFADKACQTKSLIVEDYADDLTR
jgi:hypothetical protein